MRSRKQASYDLVQRLFVACLSIVLLSLSLAIKAHTDKTLNVLVTTQVPPYVIDLEKHQGIDLEIITLVLNKMGYHARFVQGHFRRQDDMYKQTHIDALASWFNSDTENCHSSQPYREWHNAIIVPQGSVIKTLSDLKGQNIGTFYGAENVLSDYEQIASLINSAKIAENSLQAGRMVKANRIAAYLGDYVGYYYTLKAHYSEKTAKEYSRVIHYFNKNKQLICFKDPALTAKFNTALITLQESKQLQRVTERYVTLPTLNP